PMISGSTPATAKERNTARGVNPSSWALSADMTTTHAAPSLVWDELPAVTVPPCLKAGLSCARASMEVSRRIPSSWVKVTVSLTARRPSKRTRSTVTGTISSWNLPASVAAAARRWLAGARASCRSRVTLSRAATSSAVRPMLMYPSGAVRMSSGLGDSRKPVMGTRLMLSTPPARMTSAWPSMMRSAARAMACRPEEQKRLMVKPGTVGGSPARMAAMRAILIPCSPSGMAQPRMTSALFSAASPGLRRMAARLTMAARSSARWSLRVPLWALQMGVRTPATITASRTMGSLLPLVPQRLAGGQDVLHPGLALGMAAEAQERLPFEVEQVFLAHPGAGGQRAAGEDVGQLLGDVDVVLGGVAGPEQLLRR